MGRIIPPAFLVIALLLTTACHDFWDAVDDWGDCWDWDDCHSYSYYGDNGEYTTMSVVWRCPEDDATASGNFATSFRNVTIADETPSQVFDGTLAVYAWLVTGPGSDWKSAGTELDIIEYYFFALASGETLALSLVNELPEDGGNAIEGTYALIDAEHSASQGDLQDYLEALDEPHVVRSALDMEDVFGAVGDSGSFAGTIEAQGDGTFSYEIPVTVVRDEGPASYDVAFIVQAQQESADVTFQNAYGRESYTTGGTDSGTVAASSYTYAIYVSNEAVLTRAGQADTGDFNLYCGPGPALRDPVVFAAE